MAYVQTPLGGRNIMTDQERAGIQDQRQQRALDAAMAQAQLQADTQRYGIDADLAARGEFGQRAAHERALTGDFGQRADLRREMATMNPGYVRANLDRQQYEDERADNAWRRALESAIGTHVGSQIEAQFQQPGAEPLIAPDDLGGMAMSVVSPQYAQSVSQREMAQQARADQMRREDMRMAELMMKSGDYDAQRQGAALFASIMGERGRDVDPSAFTTRRQIDESAIQQSPQMQLALNRIVESNPVMFFGGDPEERAAAIEQFLAEAEQIGVDRDDAMAYLELWAREQGAELDLPPEQGGTVMAGSDEADPDAQIGRAMEPAWARAMRGMGLL